MAITLFPEIDCLLCLEKTNRERYSWTTKSYSMNMADYIYGYNFIPRNRLSAMLRED